MFGLVFAPLIQNIKHLSPGPIPPNSWVFVFAGSLSQPVLTQLPSLSTSPGASARLTCTLRSSFNVGDYYISWYQKKSGSPSCYLPLYYSDSTKHQGTGDFSHFSGSKDTSANAGVLHISGLQPEDKADYYREAFHSSLFTPTVLQTHGEVRPKPPCILPAWCPPCCTGWDPFLS
ncbi:Immunoglobulin omega chain [Tupaia chinensis]|nr:Immunoglobulin omega chain [Tupaia chinensis]